MRQLMHYTYLTRLRHKLLYSMMIEQVIFSGNGFHPCDHLTHFFMPGNCLLSRYLDVDHFASIGSQYSGGS